MHEESNLYRDLEAVTDQLTVGSALKKVADGIAFQKLSTGDQEAAQSLVTIVDTAKAVTDAGCSAVTSPKEAYEAFKKKVIENGVGSWRKKEWKAELRGLEATSIAKSLCQIDKKMKNLAKKQPDAESLTKFEQQPWYVAVMALHNDCTTAFGGTLIVKAVAGQCSSRDKYPWTNERETWLESRVAFNFFGLRAQGMMPTMEGAPHAMYPGEVNFGEMSKFVDETLQHPRLGIAMPVTMPTRSWVRRRRENFGSWDPAVNRVST